MQLSDLIGGSLESNFKSRCILDSLGNSYDLLLRTFHYILNVQDEFSNAGWLLILILFSTTYALKIKPIRKIILCCDKLIDTWFCAIERRIQLSKGSNKNTENQNIRLDKILDIMEIIGNYFRAII